ncbi:MAG: RpiB/LacA/LacB family sugar-phosphate isomerase [Alphaproteobacteria bacterium]|nr:RpiB/LacA/LacB family sugar-phosphate isomerase [Alphaproteobacteria bacterium]
MSGLTISIAADHRGFALKAAFTEWLKKQGHSPKDLGTSSEERCDAFDFASKLAKDMASGGTPFGILICGSGHAMAMTANRYKHIRAAHCCDVTMARLSREHNDANVLVIGADIIGSGVALDCLDIFLKTPFLGGRYAERRDRLTALGGL